MPIIYFVGNEENEQARGSILYNGNMQAFAVRRDNPLNLIYLGGHRVDDAPTYNITEGTIVPEYRFKNGRNIVVERQISGDVVKSVSFNLMLPNKIVSVTDRIYQLQSKCQYDLLFIPKNCESGCDEYFWLGEDLKLGSKQVTNSILGFDENEAPITTMRTAKVSGQLKTYLGLEVRELTPHANALYAVLVLDDTNTACQGCECPYQRIWRGGGDGTLAPVLQFSDNGGATWTSVVVTGLTVGHIITSLAYVDNRLVFGYSDEAHADGTAGGIGYVTSPAGVLTAVPSTLLDAAGAAHTSLGIQSLSVVGNKIYGFGTSGEILVSCDGGLSFVEFVQTAITTTILDTDYDATTGNLFIATEDAGVYVWDFTSFTDLGSRVNPTAAVDVTSVEVTGADQVMFAQANGNVYESFDFSNGNDFVQSADFGVAVYAASGDNYNYRVIAGAGNTIQRRDANTRQVFEEIATVSGNITGSYVASPLQDEGYNYFIFVTDDGETIVVASCGLCVDAGSC